MSVKKKSFDIKASKESEPVRRAPVRRRRRRASTPAPRRAKTLRERREEVRQRTSGLVLLGVVALIGVAIYLFWRPEVRISYIDATQTVQGEALASIAMKTMEGTYYNVFPRDSFFFYPEHAIRDEILKKYPVIESISISRKDLNTIILKGEARGSAFWWCGSPDEVITTDEGCFDADDSGFIFMQAIPNASSTPPLRIRAYLDMASSTDGTPIRAHVQGSGLVPEILTFIRTIESLGTAVTSVAIRADEADLYTAGGTRIMYVIGEEKDAVKDARAAFPQLNLANGTIEYVDLRFPGKVYIKRTGEIAVE